MNNTQRKIIIGAATLVGLALLFPTFVVPNGLSEGRHFLLSPPMYASVNVAQLFAEWTGIGAVAGLAWWLAK